MSSLLALALKSGSIAIYITVALAVLQAVQAVPEGTAWPTLAAAVLMAVVKALNPVDSPTITKE